MAALTPRRAARREAATSDGADGGNRMNKSSLHLDGNELRGTSRVLIELTGSTREARADRCGEDGCFAACSSLVSQIL